MIPFEIIRRDRQMWQTIWRSTMWSFKHCDVKVESGQLFKKYIEKRT